MNIVEEKLNEVIKLCESHSVDKFYVFGSILSDDFNQNSDIDFLLKFSYNDLYNYFDNYLDMKTKLEELFDRRVDLVEEQTLKNPFLIKSIKRNRKLLWKKK